MVMQMLHHYRNEHNPEMKVLKKQMVPKSILGCIFACFYGLDWIMYLVLASKEEQSNHAVSLAKLAKWVL